jgi:hypothetical protein
MRRIDRDNRIGVDSIAAMHLTTEINRRRGK